MTGCSGVTCVGLVFPPEGEVGIAMCNNVTMRVHNTPGKPGKSWNFILTFSRTGNLLNTSNKVFRIYVKRNVCRLLGELISKS